MIAVPDNRRARTPALEGCRTLLTLHAPTAHVATCAALPGAASLFRQKPRRPRRQKVREEPGPTRHGRAAQSLFLQRWSRYRSIDPPSRRNRRRITPSAKSASRGNGRPPRQTTDTPSLEAPRLRHRASYLAELMTSTARTVSSTDLAAAFCRFCLAFRHFWYAGVPGVSPHSSHDWTSGPGPAAHAERSQKHPKSPTPRIDASFPPSEKQCHRCCRRWQVICFAFEGFGKTVSGASWERRPLTSSASVRCAHPLPSRSFGHERSRLLGIFLQSLVDGGRQLFTVSSQLEQVAANAAIRRRLGLPPIVNRHAPQYPSVLWLHSQPIRQLYAWGNLVAKSF